MCATLNGKRFLTITQQVSKHLLAEIQRGRWTERMPGKPFLAAELGVNHRTVEEALQQLERDGFLLAQGKSRCRRIVPQAAEAPAQPLRVGLFLWAPTERDWTYVVDIQRRLHEAGHVLVTPKETLLDLKMNADRVVPHMILPEPRKWKVASLYRDDRPLELRVISNRRLRLLEMARLANSATQHGRSATNREREARISS